MKIAKNCQRLKLGASHHLKVVVLQERQLLCSSSYFIYLYLIDYLQQFYQQCYQYLLDHYFPQYEPLKLIQIEKHPKNESFDSHHPYQKKKKQLEHVKIFKYGAYDIQKHSKIENSKKLPHYVVPQQYPFLCLSLYTLD